MKLTKQSFIVLAPLLALAFYFFLLSMGLAEKPATAAAITLLTVIWWVSEAIPIPATSLVPFALLPMFGVVDHKTVASSLGSHVILLLMGAFMLSIAIEKSGAHHRLAVYMVRLVGVSSGRRLVLGFMLASGLLSMWISNTATTLIMLPIALLCFCLLSAVFLILCLSSLDWRYLAALPCNSNSNRKFGAASLWGCSVYGLHVG